MLEEKKKRKIRVNMEDTKEKKSDARRDKTMNL